GVACVGSPLEVIPAHRVGAKATPPLACYPRRGPGAKGRGSSPRGGAAPRGAPRPASRPTLPSLQRRQLDVAEVDLGALRLQGDAALAVLRLGRLVDLLAVDHDRHAVALAGNLILVPLAQVLLDLLLGLRAEIVTALALLVDVVLGAFQLETSHEPDVAGVAREQLCLEALGPGLAFILAV